MRHPNGKEGQHAKSRLRLVFSEFSLPFALLLLNRTCRFVLILKLQCHLLPSRSSEGKLTREATESDAVESIAAHLQSVRRRRKILLGW